MNLTIQLRKAITLLLLPLMAIVTIGVRAAEPPVNPVMESYGCSYNAGMGEKDLMAARDYYVKQANKAGVTLAASYVWSTYKGNAPVDFVWLTPHADLAAFAAAEVAQADFAADTGERFNEVADCNGNLGTISPIKAPGPEDSDQASLVSSFSCNTKHGIGEAQVQDLRDHIMRVVSALDTTPIRMWTTTPITGGSTSPDIRLHATHESLESWVEWGAAIRNSEMGASLRRHFGMVLDCNQSLWNSQQVIAPAE